MKVICGLGNPGKKYEWNRHNIGFLFIEFLLDKYPSRAQKKKWELIYNEVIIGSEKVLFVRPQSFMNLSGQPLTRLMNFFKIPKDDLCVVYDDVDLKFGDIRFREKGSAGTHNGMKSIIKELSTQDFARLRLGIESRGVEVSDKIPLGDFVLQDFSKNELGKMEDFFTQAERSVLDFIKK